MGTRSTAALRRLEAIRGDFGVRVAAERRSAFRHLKKARLETPDQIHRLHELLCFSRAYPDDPEGLELVEEMLVAFADRPDLRRHADELSDTGVAGTAIHYPFFWATARWLAMRWPERFDVALEEFDLERLRPLLPALVGPAETVTMKESQTSGQVLVDRLVSKPETPGAAVVRRLSERPIDDVVRESMHDGLDIPYVLAAGPRPSRTAAHVDLGSVVYRTEPFPRARPELSAELARAPRGVKRVGVRRAHALIDLAREAMVTRSRDLDAFGYGHPKDVSVIDDGAGLRFACIGSAPQRRRLLRAAYGLLALQNGVPIGYIQVDALMGTAEISFNTFETFRGAEAARVFCRTLAVTRHLFGTHTFSIEPYQLGRGNAEALESGAWWFYYKLGFRPASAALRALAEREMKKIRKDRAHRSSQKTLERLASEHLFFLTNPRASPKDPSFEGASRAVSKWINARLGGDRVAAGRVAEKEVLERLSIRSFGARTKDERFSVDRLAPVIRCLPGIERWSATERRAVAQIVVAKGRPRESEFVRLFDAHPKLGPAIRRLAARNPD